MPMYPHQKAYIRHVKLLPTSLSSQRIRMWDTFIWLYSGIPLFSQNFPVRQYPFLKYRIIQPSHQCPRFFLKITFCPMQTNITHSELEWTIIFGLNFTKIYGGHMSSADFLWQTHVLHRFLRRSILIQNVLHEELKIRLTKRHVEHGTCIRTDSKDKTFIHCKLKDWNCLQVMFAITYPSN